MSTPLLSISDLSILLPDGADRSNAVAEVALTLHSGETVCIVGESGFASHTQARMLRHGAGLQEVVLLLPLLIDRSHQDCRLSSKHGDRTVLQC